MTIIEVCAVFLTACVFALTSAVWEALAVYAKLTRHRLARELELEAREREARKC